jgi:hypothetical protein
MKREKYEIFYTNTIWYLEPRKNMKTTMYLIEKLENNLKS